MIVQGERRKVGRNRDSRVVMVSLMLSMVIATALWAHQALLRSHPARGERVAEAPTLLQLVFREPIQAAFTRITLLGPDSLAVPLGDLRVEGDSANIAALPLPGSLKAGRHLVNWRTTGSDGHAVTGSYDFEVLASAVPPPAPAPDAGGRAAVGTVVPGVGPLQPTLAVEGWPYVLVRWVSFASLLGVLGAAFFRLVVLPGFRRGAIDGAVDEGYGLVEATARFGRTASLLLGVATLARLGAQALTMLDPSEPRTLGWFAALLGGTSWGRAWLLQMAAVFLAWWAFRRADRPGSRAVWTATLIAALILGIAPAFSGHAIATPEWTLVAIAADSLHVLAAGGWMGGLAVMLLVGIPAILRTAQSDQAGLVARLVNAFSPPALVLGGLVAASGLVGAWLHLGAISDLWSTTYGQVLSLKLMGVGLLFGLGALNFLRVRPSLGQDAGTTRLRRSAGWELTVGIVVVLITAILVALPTAMTMNPMQIHETRVIPSTPQ